MRLLRAIIAPLHAGGAEKFPRRHVLSFVCHVVRKMRLTSSGHHVRSAKRKNESPGKVEGGIVRGGGFVGRERLPRGAALSRAVCGEAVQYCGDDEFVRGVSRAAGR